MNSPKDAQTIREQVRAGYAAIATAQPETKASGCCAGSSCCGPDNADDATALAQAIGYDSAELSSVPEGANLGLSCGNPTAIASLREGEVVVDLGSGGGFDVFIAGRKVGPSGRAIGIDMTPEMLGRARRNAETYRRQSGLDNVEFRLGEIENLPLPDAHADVIISNCVINLSPDKPRVWREMARVLKPGGRVAVSDIALVQPLPPVIAEMVEALVGCVAGAILISETVTHASEAGLDQVQVTRKDDYVDAMTSWNDPLFAAILAQLPPGTKVSDYVTSVTITAVKI
jgi:SAM-dependent methyltransferase